MNSIMNTITTEGIRLSLRFLKPRHALLGAVGVLTLVACISQPQTNANDIETPVSVRELKPTGSINRLVNTSGTAMANYSADLNSEMSGTYKLQNNPRTGKFFKLGDTVKKGELIIRLEDKEYENNIRIRSRELQLEIAESEPAKQRELLEKGGATVSQVKNAELSAMNARYELETANLNLEKMNVVAPFDGVIVNLPFYSTDTKVAANQPMVSVMNYTNLFMEINLPESTIGSVQINQPVNITHYTLPNDTLKGVIGELSPAISSETRTFKGKVLINNSELKLRPGMYVKGDVVIDRAENVIVIPKNVILSQRNVRFVYVVERNVAVRRNLTTGIEDEDNVEVLEGLLENDQLIVRGFETLRENSRVKVLR